MKYPVICIGTYHKTGTVWMANLFRGAAKKLGVPYTGDNLHGFDGPADVGIYLDYHCRIPDCLRASGMRGFRMIRDPRDVIISGAHYHVKSEEEWLHRPLRHLGEETYQQAIIDAGDWPARYDFEMRHVGGKTIKNMTERYNLGDTGFMTVRYEDMICAENGLANFMAVLGKLGFSDGELKVFRKAYERNSLLSGAKVKTSHARSGKIAQWKTIYTRDLGEKFTELHGDALISLGYEPNHEWVKKLPVASNK